MTTIHDVFASWSEGNFTYQARLVQDQVEIRIVGDEIQDQFAGPLIFDGLKKYWIVGGVKVPLEIVRQLTLSALAFHRAHAQTLDQQLWPLGPIDPPL